MYCPGGLFLLHLPWGRPHLTLSGILALWCTDFPQTANICDHLVYYFIYFTTAPNIFAIHCSSLRFI